jgi:hypothetical protein
VRTPRRIHHPITLVRRDTSVNIPSCSPICLVTPVSFATEKAVSAAIAIHALKKSVCVISARLASSKIPTACALFPGVVESQNVRIDVRNVVDIIVLGVGRRTISLLIPIMTTLS